MNNLRELLEQVEIMEKDYSRLKKENYKKYIKQRRIVLILCIVLILITNYLNYTLTH